MHRSFIALWWSSMQYLCTQSHLSASCKSLKENEGRERARYTAESKKWMFCILPVCTWKSPIKRNTQSIRLPHDSWVMKLALRWQNPLLNLFRWALDLLTFWFSMQLIFWFCFSLSRPSLDESFPWNIQAPTYRTKSIFSHRWTSRNYHNEMPNVCTIILTNDNHHHEITTELNVSHCILKNFGRELQIFSPITITIPDDLLVEAASSIFPYQSKCSRNNFLEWLLSLASKENISAEICK